jgi:hypothetical protein
MQLRTVKFHIDLTSAKVESKLRAGQFRCVLHRKTIGVTDMVNKSKSGQATTPTTPNTDGKATPGKAAGWQGDPNTKAPGQRKMKVIETEFFKFDKPGTKVAGVLTMRTPVTIRGNGTFRYTVQPATGNPVVFNGVRELNDKLANIDDGLYVEIEYSEDVDTGQGRKMKSFVVAVDESEN